MKPHKHAEMIKAKADGNIIQQRVPGWPWEEMPGDDFTFHDGGEYRIKPAEPEKVYPVTSMTGEDLEEIFMPLPCGDDRADLVGVANAVIRRPIDDGQVVIAKEFYDAINMAHKAGSEGTSLNVVVHLAGIKFK